MAEPLRKLSPEEVKELGLDASPAPAKAPGRKLSPDEVKALGLEAPAPNTPGVLETLASHALNHALPGTNEANKYGAVAQAQRDTGTAGGVLNPLGSTPPPDAVARSLANIEGRAAAGTAANPRAAGVGDVLGEIAGGIGNPVTNTVASGLLKTAGPAIGALKNLPLGALYPWLVRAATGAGIAGTAALAKGGNPFEAAPTGAAYGVAPGITSAINAVRAAQNPDKEAQTAGLVGNAVGAGLGAVNGAGELAPWLREKAQNNAVRALGMNLKAIRKAGGAEGAREVGQRALDEGLIGPISTAEQNGERALNQRDAVGKQIAQGLDTLNGGMTPELQARMRPFVVGGKLQQDFQNKGLIPGELDPRNVRVPDQGMVPYAQKIVKQYQERGDKPYTFSELNEEKEGFGKGFDATDPNNPPPPKEVQQAAYHGLNEHMESLGSEVTKNAGPEVYAKWLQDKARYGDLKGAASAAADARDRALANRSLGLSSNLVATGGGLSPQSALLSWLHQQVLNRGNSAAARGLNALAGAAEKIPAPFRPPTAAPPAAPVTPPPSPRLPPASETPSLTRDYGSMTPEQIQTLGRAQGMQQLNLRDLLSGRPLKFGGQEGPLQSAPAFPDVSIIDPESGSVLKPAGSPGYTPEQWNALQKSYDEASKRPPIQVPNAAANRRADALQEAKITDLRDRSEEPTKSADEEEQEKTFRARRK